MSVNQQSAFLIKLRNVISSSGVPFSFSDEAIRETAEIESEFKWPFIGKRLDLRGKTTFTLGSNEVAFSVEREGDDFLLGIHSADVANLIPFESALDNDAFKRGKAVFFPEKRYPMFPESISDGLCSLTEGKESFTVSVFIKVNSSGKAKLVKFAESIIKVTANCESKEVESLFFDIDVSSVGFLRYKYYSVLKQLEEMFMAGAILKMSRQDRGAVEIDTAVRTFFKKGLRGNITGVGLEKLSDPDRIVREVISAAGVEIAKFLNKHSIPCPYRYRESMTKNGNKELRQFLDSVYIDTSDVSDKNLVTFASDAAHGDRNEELILAKIKELMPSSGCSLDPKYHSGIGSKYYVRFAYPVSRYSDLSLQRIIKSVALCGEDFDSLNIKYLNQCAEKAVCAVLENEPKAKYLEKRVSELYALDYLNTNVNKTYEGTVWNVSEQVEVCLDNSCKGILRTNNGYVPGQRIKVKTAVVNMEKEVAFFEKINSYEDLN